MVRYTIALLSGVGLAVFVGFIEFLVGLPFQEGLTLGVVGAGCGFCYGFIQPLLYLR